MWQWLWQKVHADLELTLILSGVCYSCRCWLVLLLQRKVWVWFLVSLLCLCRERETQSPKATVKLVWVM